jgi:hypothetical protein
MLSNGPEISLKNFEIQLSKFMLDLKDKEL